ncbi:MAG: hypothetical protein ACPGQS_09465 [Bradymonadia bacterium]
MLTESLPGQPVVCWAVATPPELKAIRALRDLNVQIRKTPFAIYTHRERHEWVICTGVGTVAMSMGIGYLSGMMFEKDTCVWANVGVAGARDKSIGSVWGVHKIESPGGTKRLYPGTVPLKGLKTAACRTVNAVESEYPESVLYDMEAFAFMSSVSRLVHIDGLALIKVVSDNRHQSVDNVTGRMIKDLLLNAESELQIVAGTLMEQAVERHQREQLPLNWVEASSVFNFTVAEQIRLRKLLRRWSILRPGHDLLSLMRDSSKDTVLDMLEEVLDDVPVEVTYD